MCALYLNAALPRWLRKIFAQSPILHSSLRSSRDLPTRPCSPKFKISCTISNLRLLVNPLLTRWCISCKSSSNQSTGRACTPGFCLLILVRGLILSITELCCTSWRFWASMKPSSVGLAPLWWTGINVSGLMGNCPLPSRLVVASRKVHAWLPFVLPYV